MSESPPTKPIEEQIIAATTWDEAHAIAKSFPCELRTALTEIERITWREGTKFQEWLIECRKIARRAQEPKP